MDRAKLFQTGRSQAVRLPKKYRLDGKEVAIKHLGSAVLLMPLDDPWRLMAEALDEFEPGFSISREQPPQQNREDWPE